MRRLILLLLFSLPFVGYADNTYSVDLESSSQQYARVTSNEGLTGNVTFSVWFNAESSVAAGNFGLVYQSESTNDVAYHIRILSGDITFYREKTNSGGTTISYTPTINTGTWYHVMGTYDGTNLRLYWNGSLVAGPTAASGAGASGGGDCLIVGAYDSTSNGTCPANTGATFDGKIDAVVTYASALTGTDLTNLYNVPCTPFAGYRAFYEFENNLNDTSANAYNLTGSGSPTFAANVPYSGCAGGGGGGEEATTTELTVAETTNALLIVITGLLGLDMVRRVFAEKK